MLTVIKGDKDMQKITLIWAATLISIMNASSAHEFSHNQAFYSKQTQLPSHTTIVHHHYYGLQPQTQYEETYAFPRVQRRVISRPLQSNERYNQQNPTFGHAVGATLGGFAGSKLGKGSGKLATTAAGTMLGYFLGGRLATAE